MNRRTIATQSIPAESAAISASVVDLFCGAGGLSFGFKQEGFRIAGGFDIDESCRFPFEANTGAPFFRHNLAEASPQKIKQTFHKDAYRILVGCAPCQPFSTYNQKNFDPKWRLLNRFSQIIDEIRPEIVSMENVPALVRFSNGSIFSTFANRLKEAKYHVSWVIAFAPDYGVPQVRKRLVLLASKFGPLSLCPPTHLPDKYITVEDAIRGLPKIEAGQKNENDALHRASSLSALNLIRIKAAKPGGSWREWRSDIVANCHKRTSGRGYSSVYGRMVWHEPSPTITTQFFGFGNGRFGHPEQDRALSLREGAILQSFPEDYAFVQPGDDVRFKSIGRMIGNAVPVALACAIARSVRSHLQEHIT